MGLFTKRQLTGQVDKNSLPRHVAVIMDGNGRWAQKRGLPRSAGHKAGAESFRHLGTYCKKLGIDYLTVYAFSTENWKRPPEEIDGIMQLLRRYLHECIDTMERDGNRLPELRRAGRDHSRRPRLRARLRGGGEAERRADGGDILAVSLFQWPARPRAAHSAGRGEAHQQLSSLAVRVQRVLLLRYALARL